MPWDAAHVRQAGFDPDRLAQAISFAKDNESKMDRDVGAALAAGHFEEPWPIGQTIGPVKDRGDPAGLILRAGQTVAAWGVTDRVDMTFSVSKSYITLCAGIAFDDGLIRDVDAPVRELVQDGGFDSPQNRDITWRQLLQLTSEWEGTLWDKPDWIDHNRIVMGKGDGQGVKGQKRSLKRPGTHWEYNDVRVNRAALALTRVLGRSLPEVLKERVMDPIGASDTWEWHGYSNSWVEIDGRQVQSVSGGAHWGGGLWISSADHARVGQLVLNKGAWEGQRLLSEAWVAMMTTPCPINPTYGMFWWLNTPGHAVFPSASASAVFGIGVGCNLIWVEPAHDMVLVARWIEDDAVDAFIAKVLAARTG